MNPQLMRLTLNQFQLIPMKQRGKRQSQILHRKSALVSDLSESSGISAHTVVPDNFSTPQRKA
jgi:hypothetical protein